MTDSRQDRGHKQPQEDVARLYNFARVPGSGLRGTKYRDFSASRYQSRVQFRDRVQWEQAHPRGKAPAPIPPLAAVEQPGRDDPSRQSTQAQAEAVAAGVIPGECVPPPQFIPQSIPQPIPQFVNAAGVSQRKREDEPAREVPGRPELDAAPQPPHTSPQIDLRDPGEQPEEHEGARWHVLNSIFPAESRRLARRRSEPATEKAVSAVAVFSFAGGVGKTSLVATLGRALAAYGERVLLSETTPFGLLPLYFGSKEYKPGLVRVFSPPKGSPDLPVHVVSLDASPDRGCEPVRLLRDEGEQDEQDPFSDPFLEKLLRDSRNSNRILIDVQTASKATARRLLPLAPTVLIPLLPDMNSVVSLDAVRAAFAAPEDSGKPRIEPMYLLNQFDASLPLHLDVREILRRHLGASLLPFVVRRSPAMSEALAQGMTVMDYAPDSAAAEDYLHLAGWLRSTTAAAAGFGGVRWSERAASLTARGCAGSSV